MMDNSGKIKRSNRINAYITVICTVAAFVVFNAALGILSDKLSLSFDMTPNKLFVLSEETERYLENLSDDVRMYYLAETGKESPYVTEVTDRSVKKSEKITVEKIDPVKNPAFVARYAQDGETIQKGTIVVESDKRFTLVDPGAALTIIRDKNGQVSRSLGFTLEQKLTNAIDFTVRSSAVTVRYAAEHGGVSFASPASKLKAENINVEKIVLADEDISAENTDLLVLFGFKEDLSGAETEKVRNYLSGGGRLFITLDPGARPENILKIAEDYGISIDNNLLCEGNNGEIIGGSELYLKVVCDEHKICENLKNGNILFPSASSLTVSNREGVKTSYLIKTKPSAEAKELIGGEAGRKIGSGSVGTAAIGEADNNSMVFAASTSGFLAPDDAKLNNILNAVDYQNREFFVQTVKYMTGSENLLVPVAAKSIDSGNFIISNNKKFAYIILFGGLLPLAVFVFGFVLWLKRRNL